jgi:hypothetical protein
LINRRSSNEWIIWTWYLICQMSSFQMMSSRGCIFPSNKRTRRTPSKIVLTWWRHWDN